MFEFSPVVFAVKNTYQIMVRCNRQCMLWVKINGKCYFDHSNGILRSETDVYRMTVPMKELDAAKSYTVCARELIERKPYFSETKDVLEYTFNFTPVSGKTIRTYHISDTHNQTEEPINACKAFGEIDFLILNGDIPDHSGEVKNFDKIYKICSDITKGEIPVVYSRGNHDMRGVCAEKLADYTPTDGGKSYYTFRLGNIWGIVLDAGEDKPDASVEYGNTICCHAFREEETEFLKEVIKNGEFNESGIEHKLVISHHPYFYRPSEELFIIEEDIYTEWCRLIKENIKPELTIHGHLHRLEIHRPGGNIDFYGQPCTAILGADTNYEDYFAGCGIILSENEPEFVFTDNKGKVSKPQ